MHRRKKKVARKKNKALNQWRINYNNAIKGK